MRLLVDPGDKTGTFSMQKQWGERVLRWLSLLYSGVLIGYLECLFTRPERAFLLVAEWRALWAVSDSSGKVNKALKSLIRLNPWTQKEMFHHSVLRCLFCFFFKGFQVVQGTQRCLLENFPRLCCSLLIFRRPFFTPQCTDFITVHLKRSYWQQVQGVYSCVRTTVTIIICSIFYR